jgi:hypothetical protein
VNLGLEKKKYMKKFNKIFLYDGFMDDECIALCNAMNALPGITTVESCCGHGGLGSPFRIWFKVDGKNNKGLFFLTRCVDRRYWKYGYLWKIELSVGDMYEGVLPIMYCLSSGPIVGEEAYTQADSLVENMNYYLNHENFMKEYDLNIKDFDIYE